MFIGPSHGSYFISTNNEIGPPAPSVGLADTRYKRSREASGYGGSWPVELANFAPTGACSARLRPVCALAGRRDINHNDTNLLPCLNITVGVRNCCEGVLSIDDRSKLASLHAALQ
jgi:hypothetical protein